MTRIRITRYARVAETFIVQVDDETLAKLPDMSADEIAELEQDHVDWEIDEYIGADLPHHVNWRDKDGQYQEVTP